MSFKITGTGSVVPDKVLTNNDLSKFVDTSDEWITARTGIKQRFIVENEKAADLSAAAAKKAMDEAGADPKELDLIICATLQADYITPSLACLIQKEIGAECRWQKQAVR